MLMYIDIYYSKQKCFIPRPVTAGKIMRFYRYEYCNAHNKEAYCVQTHEKGGEIFLSLLKNGEAAEI